VLIAFRNATAARGKYETNVTTFCPLCFFYHYYIYSFVSAIPTAELHGDINADRS